MPHAAPVVLREWNSKGSKSDFSKQRSYDTILNPWLDNRINMEYNSLLPPTKVRQKTLFSVSTAFVPITIYGQFLCGKADVHDSKHAIKQTM